ncbi:ABC transporter substrate-binding protein [Mycobacterium sp. NAZ190054]|uniref:ABC transporter substrate-binding protein n=1 Tax=Mycobacterium sp. NAZ190054 TaxID=1747766 RepID=UPI00079379A3|nr:ABC transporter substrate-binding protein [Mycobacterium sp. NAZ190054]KWX67402.1 hypothetical protein ASJ79_21680 [Mycobacterium sp. NAZ190054]
MAFTTDVQPTYVNTRYGPLVEGPKLNLAYTPEDLKVFESHTVATQAAMSGEAQIVGGSFISTVLLQQTGQDMKVFCPFNNSDTLALVGRNGVDSVDDLFNDSVRVATDSPGGAGAMVMDAMLEAKQAPGLLTDMPNTTILESSSLRANAFAAGQVDAAVIHLRQFDAAKAQAPDGVVLATLADDVPDMIMQAFSAPSSWLGENKDAAVNFCASVITANRVLKGSFESFNEAVQQYVPEPPDAAQLESIYAVIERGNVWPEDGGISPEAVGYMTDLALRSGVLTEPADNDAVVDYEILDAAVAKADEAPAS